MSVVLFSIVVSTATAGVQPWGALSGTVGAGLDGIGRGGGGTVMVGLDLPQRRFTVAPTVSALAVRHRSGGLFQDETLGASVSVDRQVTAAGGELGVLGRVGSDAVSGEVHLGVGLVQTQWTVSGELDDSALTGEHVPDQGLSVSLTAGGCAPIGPLDLLFALRWRRIPVADVPVHLIGPTLGLRWGP